MAIDKKLQEFEELPTQIPKVLVRVSLLEAAMLHKLREHAYGEFIVHKSKGEPRRVEVTGSEVLKELNGALIAEPEEILEDGDERVQLI